MARIEHLPSWVRGMVRPARPFFRAAQLWRDVDGGRMNAAISFYGVLSLAPLVLLLVGVLGWWIDRALLEKGLVTQIGTIVGEQGSALIRQALASAKAPREGLLASLAGFAVLLSGATGVFGELQCAFERLWVAGSGTIPQQKWWHGASLRLRGIAYVLAFGFLLLVSLVISASAADTGRRGPGWPAVESRRQVSTNALRCASHSATTARRLIASSSHRPRA